MPQKISFTTPLHANTSITDTIKKLKTTCIENKNRENFVHVFEEDEIIITTCKTNLLFLNDNTETPLADGTLTYCEIVNYD